MQNLTYGSHCIILLISLDFVNLTHNNHFSQTEALVFDQGGCFQQQGLSGCLHGVQFSLSLHIPCHYETCACWPYTWARSFLTCSLLRTLYVWDVA